MTPTIIQTLRKCRAVLLRRGVSDCDVDDVVHDAFLRVKQYESTHQVHSAEAMLIRTAVNISIDRERSYRRSPLAPAPESVDQIMDLNPGPDAICHARAELRRLEEGLRRLKDKSRRILLARRLHNLSVAEIAVREGMTPAAVEKQIIRSTLNLMNWMGEC